MELLDIPIKFLLFVLIGGILGFLAGMEYMDHRFRQRIYEIQSSISSALDEHVTIDEFLDLIETGEIEMKWTSREIIE